MFTEILVPLDGGRIAEQAIPLATALARRHGSRLHFVGVSRPVAFTNPGAFSPEVPLTSSVELDLIAAEELARYLADWSGRVASADGVAVRSAVLKGAEPAGDQLVEYAAKHRIELVIMHTHARGAMRRLWLGSVANALAQKSGIPCLLLRGPLTATAEAELPVRPRRIVVPLDGSTEAELAVELALACADPDITELELLTIVSPLPFPGSVLEGAALETRTAAAERYLARVASRATEADIVTRSSVVVHASPSAAIVSHVQQCGADLVVIAAHFRSGVNRVFLGSVMDRLLRKTYVPMLVWRSKELAGTELLPLHAEPMELALH
ncbi:MAG TPA: universal stress protein [Gemmatimonadales bacterium]|jgi:nucleotide-binding universal stress UspA family protein|nr:universal stress protein [Gemmatimonadales bacterium]